MKQSITLIVKRGALRRFDRLKKDAAGLPVDVIWDRRQSQRRRSEETNHSDEKRKVERRNPLPLTWEVAEFAVAEEPDTRKKK